MESHSTRKPIETQKTRFPLNRLRFTDQKCSLSARRRDRLPYRTATYSTGIQQRRKFMQSSYLKEKSKRMQLYANQPADNREYRFLPRCKQEQ